MVSNWGEKKYEKYIQIRHKCAILYTLPADGYTHKRHEFATTWYYCKDHPIHMHFMPIDCPECSKQMTGKKKSQGTYQGKVTGTSAKNIRKAVDMLQQISPRTKAFNPVTKKQFWHTLSFITLTIPPGEFKPFASWGHKHLLAPWLLNMKRKHGLNTYLWKAEFQQNGMLHYHITTPSVIHYQFIKDCWNNLLRANDLLIDHFSKFDDRYPNGTDIHEVYKNKKLQFYLSKEIAKAMAANAAIHSQGSRNLPGELSKTIQSKATKGKVWDCSMNLKEYKHYAIAESSNPPAFPRTAIVKQLQSCTVVACSCPIELLRQEERKGYYEHIRKVKGSTSQQNTLTV